MKRFLSIILLFLIILFIPKISFGFNFNPNNIISDFDLWNPNAMSQLSIQYFLDKYNSPLKNYKAFYENKVMLASEIIYKVAKKYNINPKFILVKLQQEQGLIEGKPQFSDKNKLQKAIDWACGFSLCDSCVSGNIKYKGFTKQLEALADVQNIYRQKSNLFAFKPGRCAKTLDNFEICPENQATANLYIYTPWKGGDSKIGGNYLFAKIWDKYFGKAKYPDGTILKDTYSNYYLIQDGLLRKYKRNVYLSMHTDDEAVRVSKEILDAYPKGPEIKFPNYSLLRTPDKKIYLLVDNTLRKIKDTNTFKILGFNPEEIIDVKQEDIKDYKIGFPIGPKAIYPQGALLQSKTSGAVFWVQNGKKYPIIDKSILDINYKNYSIIKATDKELNSYQTANFIKLKDGSLVKYKDTIYIISNGFKRPFASQAVFEKLYGKNKLSKIKNVPKKVLDLHPLGKKIDIFIETTFNKSTKTKIKQTLLALPISNNVPNKFNIRETKIVKISYKNKGTIEWKKNEVYLKIETNKIQKINLKYSILPKAIAKIEFPLKFDLPYKGNIKFALYKNNTYIKGSLLIKQIEISSSYSAKLISHNLRPAIKNKWILPVTIKIQNLGQEKWKRARTALKIYDDKMKLSPFYDPNDWLTSEIAATPINPKKNFINPYEISEFKFTLKGIGLKPGFYKLKMQIELRDLKKIVKINGKDYLEFIIRVDN